MCGRLRVLSTPESALKTKALEMCRNLDEGTELPTECGLGS